MANNNNASPMQRETNTGMNTPSKASPGSNAAASYAGDRTQMHGVTHASGALSATPPAPAMSIHTAPNSDRTQARGVTHTNGALMPCGDGASGC